MKKRILSLILALLLLCTACARAEDTPTTPPAPATTTNATTAPTQAPTDATTVPAHICVSQCDICGLCTNSDCSDALCAEKCTGPHNGGQLDYIEDYITDSPVSIDTGTLVIDIGENVYVPGHLTWISKAIAAAMEKVSGLSFEGAGYARPFPDGKVHVTASRDQLYVGQDWYKGLDTSEVGSAYGGSMCHAVVSPGDLFLGGSTVIHELSHVLMFRQSEWSHCQVLNEGISTYTTLLALMELEQAEPLTSYYLGSTAQTFLDMGLTDSQYEALFSQPLEYWFENTLDSFNANYPIGFRFMSYLDNAYGDYTKWIIEFEKAHSYAAESTTTNVSNTQHQIQVLKATYGDDVLDNFYPWLKENRYRFDAPVLLDEVIDLSAVTEINWYPEFNAIFALMRLDNVKYQDLIINLDPGRKYLSEYKGLDISELYLSNPNGAPIICYLTDGTITEASTETKISLENVSRIQLVGSGTIHDLQVMGFAAE